MSGRSRARQERTIRRAELRKQVKIGKRADRLGDSVDLTVSGVRQAVVIHGHDRLAQALLARHNRRLANQALLADQMQSMVLPTLNGFLPLDIALARLSASSSRAPAFRGRQWVDHLGWGLDSVAAACRLMMTGQVVGASVIARSQLERWSENIAHDNAAGPYPGEKTADWIGRLWSIHGVQDGGRNSFGGPSGIDAGRSFSEMSELVHGRGQLVRAAWWESVELLSAADAAAVQAFDFVHDALDLSVKRIHAAICTAASARQLDSVAADAWNTRAHSRVSMRLDDIQPLLMPLLPSFFMNDSAFYALTSYGFAYRGEVDRGAKDFPIRLSSDGWGPLGFAERRARAAHAAKQAFLAEADQFGESFDNRGIENTFIESILACEMAGLIAVWLREAPETIHAADALVIAANSLRSAVNLWLEDDERSMGCLRVLVEQIASSRTWRLKPTVAQRLHDRGKLSTPRDWIEKSGWKRLAALNEALGSYAHGLKNSDWDSARETLIQLQADLTKPAARQRGKTSTLINSIVFLNSENAEWLSVIDRDVESAYWKVVRLTRNGVDKGMDDYLQRAWVLRKRGISTVQ
ncbi:hypothetical protein [Rhodococcus sp. AW25M09]|uniref:hypothetical protein n=1 Tax=Rhodococcus sp. AW25M09 TaxID=1268303 RepID=UPI0012F9CED6|nr:hypothetical protein [Rhodococcus sp. AW25M09]